MGLCGARPYARRRKRRRTDEHLICGCGETLPAFRRLAIRDGVSELQGAPHRRRFEWKTLRRSLPIAAVKRLGGSVIVQSPEDAEYPGMPLAAIATGFVDHIVTKDTLVTAICNAVEQCGRHSDLAAWEAPFKSFETSSPVSPVRVLDTSPN